MKTGYYAEFELRGPNVNGRMITQSCISPLFGRTQRELNDEIVYFVDYLNRRGNDRKMVNIKKFKVTEL